MLRAERKLFFDESKLLNSKLNDTTYLFQQVHLENKNIIC